MDFTGKRIMVVGLARSGMAAIKALHTRGAILAAYDAKANFTPGDKRMHIIPLDAGGMVIDDTYNANPLSAIAALEACQQMSQGRRKVAVLGDMLELGNYEIEGHKKVGKKAAELDIDILITIGDRAKYYKEGAAEAGLPVERIFDFTEQAEALKWIEENISPADVILFKASRGMQLDKMVQNFLGCQRDGVVDNLLNSQKVVNNPAPLTT